MADLLKPARYLEVGFTPDMRHVMVNHPFMVQDERGGHIVFTPAEARALGNLLLRKADECEHVNQGELTQCDGEDSYE
jgi:hypothetical protein